MVAWKYTNAHFTFAEIDYFDVDSFLCRLFFPLVLWSVCCVLVCCSSFVGHLLFNWFSFTRPLKMVSLQIENNI